VDAELVARVHEQVLAQVRVQAREVRVIRERQRVGGRLGLAALGDVRPVDGLLANEEVVVQAVGVLLYAGVVLVGQAVDCQVGAPLRRAAAEARELRDLLTAALVDVESAIIVAAGLEANFPADLAVVRSFSKPGVTS